MGGISTLVDGLHQLNGKVMFEIAGVSEEVAREAYVGITQPPVKQNL